MPFAHNGECEIHFIDRGAGQPILFIPGLGLTADAWDRVAGELAGDHRILALDPRGAGQSSKPDSGYDAATLAADVEAVLDAAGLPAAHIVGLSMGGMIAQDVAIGAPGRVNSLVLVSTYAATDAWSQRLFEVRKMILEQLGLSAQFKLSVLTVTGPATFRNRPEIIAGFEEAITRNAPDEHAYLRQMEYCMSHDARGELERIEAPTLVITGSMDLLTSPFQGKDLANGIPNAIYREVEGCTHLLVFEEPTRFAAEVKAFVASRSAP